MAMSNGLVWQVEPSVLTEGVKRYGDRLLSAIEAVAQLFAARVEAFAKANAPWTDRTANARQGLTATVTRDATGVVLYLFHQMTYGIFLEVKNAGRYGIILQTLETHYGDFMAAIRRLLKG